MSELSPRQLKDDEIGSHIETFTGRLVDPLNLRPEDICIGDIAHALSNQCRFSGHTRTFYSVAEHSVRVSWWIEEEYPRLREFQPQVLLWGLLHDASEAYLVDLPTPIKRRTALGQIYRDIEKQAMAAILSAFHLSRRQPHVVSEGDAVLLMSEIDELMSDPWRPRRSVRLAGSRRQIGSFGWFPKRAEGVFLQRYDALGYTYRGSKVG